MVYARPTTDTHGLMRSSTLANVGSLASEASASCHELSKGGRGPSPLPKADHVDLVDPDLRELDSHLQLFCHRSRSLAPETMGEALWPVGSQEYWQVP